jgi:hypothetical protein
MGYACRPDPIDGAWRKKGKLLRAEWRGKKAALRETDHGSLITDHP